MSNTSVSLSISGRIARLQIERPDALNAIDSQVLVGIENAVEQLRQNKVANVVVISGAGEKAFVAGADLKFMQNLSAADAAAFSQYGNKVFSSLSSLPQVVVAKVQGFALGGGLELALACDFIIASEKAKFGLPEVSLGLIPGFGGTQRLARRIGTAKALEWMTTAQKYTAEDALKVGLANQVVAHSVLDEVVDKIASQIANNGPAAVRAAKHALRYGVDASLGSALELEAGYFGVCFSRPESKEGIGAFVEKRQADFSKF